MSIKCRSFLNIAKGPWVNFGIKAHFLPAKWFLIRVNISFSWETFNRNNSIYFFKIGRPRKFSIVINNYKILKWTLISCGKSTDVTKILKSLRIQFWQVLWDISCGRIISFQHQNWWFWTRRTDGGGNLTRQNICHAWKIEKNMYHKSFGPIDFRNHQT